MYNLDNINLLKSEITNFILNQELSFLFIRGDSGSGKTMAIKEIIKESRQSDSENIIIYSHTPIFGGSCEIFQSFLSGMNGFFERKRTEFETIKVLERNLKYMDENGGVPIVVMDDAQHLRHGKKMLVMDTLKQLTETSKVKFIFMSTEELFSLLPLNVARRSKEHHLRGA